jgi:hypothetical protein
MLMSCVSFKPEDYKNIAEAVALVMAALFFLFKLISGYLVSNLTLSLTAKRVKHPTEPGMALLAVDLTLTKGDRESALLKNVTITVTPVGEPAERKPLASPSIEGLKRMIRLAAGEGTQFSEVWNIPIDSVCHIEAAVDARVGFMPSVVPLEAHWKASAVSLPSAQLVIPQPDATRQLSAEV